MMPWSHFVVAALPITAYTLVQYRRPPRALLVVAMAVGTQFPDLVDKPLAWRVGLLPNGRMFMHSLVFAVPISVLVVVIASAYDQKPLGVAFVCGYLLHIPGDFYRAFVGPKTHPPTNMLWPLLPPQPSAKPEYVTEPSAMPLSAVDGVLLAAGVALVGYACLSLAHRHRHERQQ